MLLTPERTFLVSRSLKRQRFDKFRAPHFVALAGEFPNLTAFGCHRPKTDIVRVNVTEGSLSLRAARGDHR